MKVQLYSGGMDSYIISKLWKPDVKLYINYNSNQNKAEMQYLPKDVIVKDIDLSNYIENDGLQTIPLRNLIFAAIAVNYGDEILIGGLKSDLHYDKTEEFADATTKLFNSVLTKEASKRTVKIVVPYRSYTKTELVHEFLTNGGTVEELLKNSWSCYKPLSGYIPCGECKACKARAKAIKEATQ